MIIAVCGLKRSGKNTTGSYLVENYGFKEYSFAKPIKEACCVLFDWSLDYIEEHKEDIDERWGISPRQALQYLGTEDFQYNLPNQFPLFKETVGRAFWVKRFENEYQKDKNSNYVITDFRFRHEEEIIKTYDSYTVKVINSKIEANDLHESERYVQEMETDFCLLNNSSKEDLYYQIDGMMDYINKYR